jgi:hypothetical protein
MDLLLDEGMLRAREINLLYESIFLRAVTIYEVFCEELFYKLLSAEVSYPKSKKIASRVQQCDDIEQLVLYGERFLEWIPFAKTTKRTGVFLRDGRPFSLLEKDDKDKIHRITKIRNAIAHKSQAALSDFRLEVINQVSALLPHEKSPATFLRSEISPGVKRIEAYLGDLVEIAQKLYGKPL